MSERLGVTQVGGAVGVALIGGFTVVSTALAASGVALVLGGPRRWG